MLIAVIILAYFVFTLALTLIVIGHEDGFKADEWFATIVFIISPVLFGIIKLLYKVHRRRKRRSTIKKKLKEKGNE